MAPAPVRIGVDAGGTFTDFLVLREDGSLDSFKLRSNPANPAEVILAGLERAGAGEGTDVVHGSTVATNALLERKGARTAFVTTAGFEDLVAIGRQNRSALFSLHPPPRRSLSCLSLGIAERVWHDGTRARAPSRRDLLALRKRLREAGVESVAVCLLHAYQTPDHEQAVARALGDRFVVSLSHEVSPEFREYERASTTLVNAYVGPLMDAYLGELERRARQPVSILQSNGGVMSTSEARRHAVRTILSGPAGGVAGTAEVARLAGYPRVLGFDMGGTSTDVSLADGKPAETTEAYVDGLPIRVPMLDIHTVGAGGGSIAFVDAGGLLRVGPRSAGAVPGPACYGSGDEATVTDAHVVLGRISEQQLLGGAMRLHAHRAAAAVGRLAGRLDLTLEQAAAGILAVANANMERAIRLVSVERGHDPRAFALLAFGGCGGLHACELAGALGMRTVLVPEHAGALSALGMLLADRVRDYAAGVLRDDAAARFPALEQRALSELPGASIERYADVRYAGQSYELTVPWPEAPGHFHRAHQQLYGYCRAGHPVETVTIRVRARRTLPKPQLRFRAPAVGPEPVRRRVFVAGAWHDVAVCTRDSLPGPGREGPLLITDYGSTTLVPPGWHARLDGFGTLVVERR